MKPAAGARRLDAQQLGVDGGLLALLDEQTFAVVVDVTGCPRYDGARGACVGGVDVDQRELSLGGHQLTGQCDGVAAAGPAVHANKHIGEHRCPPCRGPTGQTSRYRRAQGPLSGRTAVSTAGFHACGDRPMAANPPGRTAAVAP